MLNKYDEQFYLKRFTPRQPKSVWPSIIRKVIEQLILEGKMLPQSLAHVEAARLDGRWEAAYELSSSIQIPEDFQAALALHPQELAFFDIHAKANRYAFLYRLHHTKKIRKSDY